MYHFFESISLTAIIFFHVPLHFNFIFYIKEYEITLKKDVLYSYDIFPHKRLRNTVALNPLEDPTF